MVIFTGRKKLDSRSGKKFRRVQTSMTLKKSEHMGIADFLSQKKAAAAAANLQAGQAFLANNAQKEGVVTLPSGLQYEIVRNGTGENPGLQNRVTCHYHGTLIDGTVFDSSEQRGQPAIFPVSAVIKGWTEALQLMSVGSRWRLYIPPQLGYGDRQVGSHIGPNSTLIFEVELLSFV